MHRWNEDKGATKKFIWIMKTSTKIIKKNDEKKKKRTQKLILMKVIWCVCCKIKRAMSTSIEWEEKGGVVECNLVVGVIMVAIFFIYFITNPKSQSTLFFLFEKNYLKYKL